MPLRKVEKFTIIEPEILSYRDKYWPALGKLVKDQIGNEEVSSAEQVQKILKQCFAFLCNEFEKLLKDKPSASFFLFVQMLHEDSVEIWEIQTRGRKLPIDQEEFAGCRRMMKYVLEQGCTIDLIGHTNFQQEIIKRTEEFTKHLEELIYLTSRAFEISEYIARSQLCPHSISLKVEDNELTIYINQPFNDIFSYIFEDNSAHSKSVVVSDSIKEFKKILNEEQKLNYDHLSAAIFEQIRTPGKKFAVFDLIQLIDFLVQKHGFTKEHVETFYSGLTITRENVLSFEGCILKTQDNRRHMYRPILKYLIDGKPYWLIGANKWMESIVQIMTNCIPFGIFPVEWTILSALNAFQKRIKDSHDKILENPAIELIKKANLKYDNNIKVVVKANNQNVSLVQKDIGEIDLIFINEEQRIIFLAECKHNRSRYEFYNWKKEIDNFSKSYEGQLNNKHLWLKENKVQLLEHFEFTQAIKIDEKEKYTIVPMFIINAPSLYLYNSQYLVVTLHDLDRLLAGKHTTVEFYAKIAGKKVTINKPYFANAEKYFN